MAPCGPHLDLRASLKVAEPSRVRLAIPPPRRHDQDIWEVAAVTLGGPAAGVRVLPVEVPRELAPQASRRKPQIAIHREPRRMMGREMVTSLSAAHQAAGRPPPILQIPPGHALPPT